MLERYLVVVGVLAVGVALLSDRLRTLPVSEPLLALVAGVVAGPEVLDLLRFPTGEAEPLLQEVARVLLAVSLMAVALRYPVRETAGRWRPVALLVLVVMPVTAAVTAAVAGPLLGLSVAGACLLGAALCPTDPVLASNVVTGERAERALPARLRQTLSLESGSNDGLALPLVLLGVALVHASSLGAAVLESAYQVGAGVLLGAVLGVLGGKLVNLVERRREMERPSALVFTLPLAFLVLGVGRVVHADGILAVFVAGLAYNLTQREGDRESQDEIDEVVNRYLLIPLFVLVGVALPWAEWGELGAGRVVAAAVLVLLARRLLPVLVLHRPLRLSRPEAAMLGWFGPVGVSAVFYLGLAAEEDAAGPALWAAGLAVVVASTVLHGMTAAPLRVLFSRSAAAPAPSEASG